VSGVVLSERNEARSPGPGPAWDDEELAIVRLLADGLVLDAIARRLAVSERTVRRRIRALCDRFGVDTPVQVVVIAAHHGVL
jgi:DNA-binding NarL/FixJ family response regulator